jgi:hypothetical protein
LETAGFRVITAYIYQFTGEDSMVKRRTWFILVVAVLLAAVGGYEAYIHFLTPAEAPHEPALQMVAEAISTNSPTFTPTAVPTDTPTATPTPTTTPTLTPIPTPTHPLMIEVMRQQAYPGVKSIKFVPLVVQNYCTL